jgi:hypothetical protein
VLNLVPISRHSFCCDCGHADSVTFVLQPDRVRIEIGGKHFSDYIHAGWPKPCLYPILDADGTSYTRDFPFKR